MANKNVGSVRQGWASVANDGFLDIRPPAPTSPATNAEEWRVLAIHVTEGSSIEVHKTNGVNSSVIATNNGGLANFQWVVTRDIYLRVKNVSGVTTCLGYDAYVSMEEN